MAIAVARDIGGRPRRRLQRGFQRRVDMMRAVAGGSGLGAVGGSQGKCGENEGKVAAHVNSAPRSEEHTSELQSLMRISYAAFCLNKKTLTTLTTRPAQSSKKKPPPT